VVFAILLTSLLVVGGVALWSVQSWRNAVGVLRAVRAQSLRAEQLRSAVLHQMKEMYEHLLVGDLDAEREVRTVQQRVDQLLAELRGGARSDEEAALIVELELADRAIEVAAVRLFREVGAGRLAPARTILEDELDETLFPRQVKRLEALAVFYRRQLERVNEETLAANRLLRALTAMVLLFVLGAAVALLVGSRRWLVRPLDEIGRSIAVIGTGNLAHRVPVRAQDELGLIASAVNRMAAALSESQARLVDSQRLAAVGELSSYIAHNIRNPLAAVRSAAQVGLADVHDAEATREVLRDIIAAVDKLEGWVRQLLGYSGPLHLARVPHDINTMLRDVLALLQPTVQAKGLGLALDLAPVVPAVPLDEQHMEQALAAIVSNALDACRPGGHVKVSTRRTNDGIDVAVVDDGEGMASEVLQKVFQPYFTTKPAGVGLGLVMARRVVEGHGGTIEIASAEGSGTTVTMHLPD
jgi:signal transduction histidine kinase